MENFAALVTHLLARQAVVQVHDAPSLQREIEAFLSSPERRAQIGARGHDALTPHQGATARTVGVVTRMRDYTVC
jgi:3-deoxy-D-manno-octulosonic-acid transferase